MTTNTLRDEIGLGEQEKFKIYVQTTRCISRSHSSLINPFFNGATIGNLVL